MNSTGTIGLVAANDFNHAIKNKFYMFLRDTTVIGSHVDLQQNEILLLLESSLNMPHEDMSQNLPELACIFQ